MWKLKSAETVNPRWCVTKRSAHAFAALAAYVHLALLAAAHAPGADVVGKDVELLRLAATEQRANLQRLRTWRARVIIRARSGDPTLRSVNSEKTIEFAYDQDRGIWWRWDETSKASDRPKKIAARSNGAVSTADGGTYFRSEPAAPNGDGATVIIFPEAGQPMTPHGISAKNFDPRYFFRQSGEDVGERFLFFCDLHKDGRWPAPAKVHRDGELVVLALGNTSGTVSNRYTTDLTKAGNLVQYDSTEDSDVQRTKHLYKYAYKQFDGVWVPNRIREQGMTLEGAVFYEKETEWLENVVNESLRAGLFTIAAVGARDGDIVDDQRAMVRYVYSGDAPAASGQRWLKWVLLRSAAALAVIASGFLWRAAKKRRAGFGAGVDTSVS